MLWDVLEGFEDLGSIRGNDSRFYKINRCTEFGFELPEMLKVFDESSRDDLEILIDTLKNVAVKRGIPIDGLVMKYDSIAYSKQKGGTSHHNNDGIAFKFEDETADTVLQDIEWSLGRTGQLTPVAIFDPVDLDGTVVTRASVHNLSIMRNLLGKPFIGQKVCVAKQNMIIPQIIKAEKLIE